MECVRFDGGGIMVVGTEGDTVWNEGDTGEAGWFCCEAGEGEGAGSQVCSIAQWFDNDEIGKLFEVCKRTREWEEEGLPGGDDSTAMADSENTGEVEDAGGAAQEGVDTDEDKWELEEANIRCSSKRTCLER